MLKIFEHDTIKDTKSNAVRSIEILCSTFIRCSSYTVFFNLVLYSAGIRKKKQANKNNNNKKAADCEKQCNVN